MPIHFLKKSAHKKQFLTENDIHCTLKAHIQLKSISSYHAASESNQKSVKNINLNELNQVEESIIVRAYIVQGKNLRSLDKFGYSDSFLNVSYGKQKFSTRDNYILNQTNPIYGQCFQFTGLIPRDQFMKISVYDYDNIGNDLIGETIIDIEDRIRTMHRAHCGVAHEYTRSGYNIWRDALKPSEILNTICHKCKLKSPSILGTKIEIDGIFFNDESVISIHEDLVERLSLTVLNNLEKVPAIGFKLVPEHVETRSLYHKDRPGIEQVF